MRFGDMVALQFIGTELVSQTMFEIGYIADSSLGSLLLTWINFNPNILK